MAVAANFVNKLAVKLLPAPNVILLIQTLTTLLGLQTLSALGVVRLPPPASIRVWQMAPLVVTYVIHALLVLYSLAFLSVPMYNTLKRLTPVLVLATKVGAGGVEQGEGRGTHVATPRRNTGACW